MLLYICEVITKGTPDISSSFEDGVNRNEIVQTDGISTVYQNEFYIKAANQQPSGMCQIPSFHKSKKVLFDKYILYSFIP